MTRAIDVHVGPLQDRVLFGTDYPFLTHEQWLGASATLEVPDDVTEKVLLRNAERLLGFWQPR
jgi:predicted TIM-barrel fold metal-dependent hydrolase